jgi:type 1 glutamine amidotransferase/HEAT repeat protein
MAPVDQRVNEKGKLMRNPIGSYIFTSVLISAAAILPAHAQLSQEAINKIQQAAPAKATVQPRQPRTLLVFNRTEGYRHAAIEYASKALEIMGKKTGAYETVQSEDLSVFKPESLRRFDAVCFNNTTQLKFDDPGIRQSLLEFLALGKGIIGIHAATDNFPTWPEGLELLGGVFDGHPWTADGTWGVKIMDPAHPLNAAFHGKDFLIKDEIYRVRQINLRKNSRVLLGLDMKLERNRRATGVRRSDRDVPISWVRTYGKGRLFYCSLGHNDEVYTNPAVLQHYLDGIQFAFGDYTVDTTPVPFDLMSFFVQDTVEALLRRIATYQHGDSRASLADLNEFIRNVDDLAEAHRKLEIQFLGFLGGNATLAGKQFICTRLALVGSEASVPRLVAMLSDPATVDMALFALESIEGKKVDEALIQTLETSKDRTAIGIIGALGRRRVQNATPVLGCVAAGADSSVSTAAVSALGAIGTREALEVLHGLKHSGTAEARRGLYDAMLACAAHLEQEGGKDQALAVYRELNAPGEPLPVRAAALKRMILADPGNAAVLVLNTLRSSDVKLHPAAIQMVKEISGSEDVRAIARTFPDLRPVDQAQLLAFLSHRRDPEVQKVVVGATASKNASVRAAALRALGSIGDAAVVPLLAHAAATSRGADQKEARASLYTLNAPGVEDSIVAAFPVSDNKVKVELLKSIGERRRYSAVPLVLQTAKDPAGPVRIESAKVLKSLARGDQLPAMVDLLMKSRDETERRELENAIAATARRMADTARRDEAVLAVYPSLKNNETRASFINVLGKIGAPASLSVCRTALGDKNPGIQLAAIRALSEWPTADPYADLWKVATTARDHTHRILALRGAVRLIGLDTTRPADETVSRYRESMKIAANKEELKLLLSALGEARSLAAFQLAAGCMKQKDLRQEAEVAVVTIGEGIAGIEGPGIISDLKRVAQHSKNDTIVNRAQTVIANIERLEDYITAWEIAGPYMKEGSLLFSEPFAPEGPDASSVQWKLFHSMTDPSSPWRLEFDKVIGGDDRVVYIRTYLWSPIERKARMEVGSRDGVKIWLNGELIHAKDVVRAVTPGEDIVPVTLKNGWNALMMKVDHGTGNWGACARFRMLDGKKLEGVRVSVNKN